MAAIFESLQWADGKVNPSGIKNEVFFAPKSWIKHPWPAIDPLPATATENVTLEGNFDMVAGKTFQRLYSTQGKGKVDFEPMGEKDCRMFMAKGLFKFPDIDDAGKNMAKGFINANVVYVVPVPHETEKRYVVLGDDYYDTSSTIAGTSGDAPGSDKGLTINVEVPCTTPLPNYKGILLLPDGSLDCATGIFTANDSGSGSGN
jgi:hypothetical protein